MQVPVSAATSQVAGPTAAGSPSHDAGTLHGQTPTDELETMSMVILKCGSALPVNACCALWLCTPIRSLIDEKQYSVVVITHFGSPFIMFTYSTLRVVHVFIIGPTSWPVTASPDFGWSDDMSSLYCYFSSIFVFGNLCALSDTRVLPHVFGV